jgi:hypothetical protein
MTFLSSLQGLGPLDLLRGYSSCQLNRGLPEPRFVDGTAVKYVEVTLSLASSGHDFSACP